MKIKFEIRNSKSEIRNPKRLSCLVSDFMFSMKRTSPLRSSFRAQREIHTRLEKEDSTDRQAYGCLVPRHDIDCYDWSLLWHCGGGENWQTCPHPCVIVRVDASCLGVTISVSVFSIKRGEPFDVVISSEARNPYAHTKERFH
jgi:hypothetical protein